MVPCGVDLREPELVPRVGPERVVRHQLVGYLPGERWIQAAPDVDRGLLLALERLLREADSPAPPARFLNGTARARRGNRGLSCWDRSRGRRSGSETGAADDLRALEAKR